MRNCAILGFTVLAVMISALQLFADEIEIGAQAPDISVAGVDGKQYSLKSLSDAKAVVVCFTCNSCPVAVSY